eukprot:jgi/Botrbrau1/6152/Bobra.331_2s0042.1
MGQSLCKCGRPEVKEEPKAPPPVIPQVPGRPSPDEPPDGFQATHTAVRLLGRGAAADTWLFQDLRTKHLVAIKLFPLPIAKHMVPNVVREISIQAELGPGCINLINVYEAVLTKHHLGLVMEYAAGGSLTSAVAEAWTLAKPGQLVMSEDRARYLFRQSIEAVNYCHRHYIAHRDLKLDNTLLNGEQPTTIKICDFGFARHFAPQFERAFSHLGTPEYMGPEILHNLNKGVSNPEDYNVRAVDVWAAGVMLVVALLGAFPFDHSSQHVTATDSEVDLWIQEVSRAWEESPFISSNVKALSPEARDLLDKIFVVDPKQRITVEGIMQHPWYTAPLSPEYQAAYDQIQQEQSRIDSHIKHRKLDLAKVEARNQALVEMIKAASEEDDEKPVQAKRRLQVLRPLHNLDMQNTLRTVDLTEAAVLVPGTCTCDADDVVLASRTGSFVTRSGNRVVGDSPNRGRSGSNSPTRLGRLSSPKSPPSHGAPSPEGVPLPVA